MDDQLFFAVCPKCDKKIYKYQMLMEYPKGFFDFAVKCDCGQEFHHRMASQNAHLKKVQEDMIKQLNPDAIHGMVNKMMGRSK